MKVVVTGASGLVGSALVPFLEQAGHDVRRLVRRPAAAAGEVHWEPARGQVDGEAFLGSDAVVHLAGENIAARRWTAERKAELRSSRLGPTRFLSETLAGLARPPRVLVSSSAIGYYGDRADAWLDEDAPPGDGFLARLSAEWEQATEPARATGIRVVKLRTGLVLTPAGGALGRMLPLFRMGAGGVLGPGTQYMSWIAIDDLVAAIEFALGQPALAGPVNAVSPEPVTNRQLTKALGRVLRRPTIAQAPAFALRLAFGELADATLLASTRVRPARLAAAGYRFRFPDLAGALQHLLARSDGEG